MASLLRSYGHTLIRLTSLYFFIGICMSEAVPQPKYNGTVGNPAPNNLRLAAYYTDNMVLQMEPHSAVIWGYVGGADTILVTLKGKVYSAKAQPVSFSSSFVWKVVLDPTPPSGPFEIGIRAVSSGEVIVLREVLFGDVWICSGQSNMAFNVPNIFNASEVLKDSYSYPNIRLLAVHQNESTTPYYDLKSLYIPWSKPSPVTLGDDPADYFLYFSAVCYLFGVEMHKHLGYPIGLISDNWGGTPIQAWSAPEVMESCPNSSFPHVDELTGPGNSSVLWNAMIHPLLNFTIKGALWYQGEANTPEPAYHYACLFPNMIKNWRNKWFEGTGGNTNKTFPFGFVQLSTSNIPFNDTNYPPLRWAQTADYGYVPNPSMENVFMAVAIDLPDPSSPFHAIHPRDKQDVAYRLSVGAKAVAYNEKYVEYRGPFPIKICNLTSSKIQVDYTFGDIKILSNDVFEVCCDDVLICRTKETAWMKADAISPMGPASIAVGYQCPEGTPTLLRYLWQDMPCQFKKCAIYRADSDLPAPPFNLPVDATCG